MPDFQSFVEAVGVTVDGVGVVVIVVGAGVASARFLFGREPPAGGAYRAFRHDLGRAILLGLEFLVAADIIRTVAVNPTLESVTVLAAIVLVRTFLSMALEVELEGRWPWRRVEQAPAPPRPRP